jgi:hypothetical protein
VDEGDGLAAVGRSSLLAMAGAVPSKVDHAAGRARHPDFIQEPVGLWPRRVRRSLPGLRLAAPLAVTARAAGANFSTFEKYGLSERVALFAYSLWYYAATFVAPTGLAPYHEPPTHVSVLAPVFLAAALGVVAITTIVVLLRRHWPGGIAAWAFYVVVLVPVGGLVHSGSHLVAERYAYLPTIGFALLLGGGAAALSSRWRTQRWAAASLSVMLR